MIHRILPHACATIALACSASAATMSASSTAPAVNGADIANYGDVSGTDKWFVENSTAGAAKGQSITTGGATLRLKAITYQVGEGNGAAPTKTYALRVGKIAGTNFTQVHSETATQNFSWTSGQYMTWTFDTPVMLEPYTTYGIDVGMTGSTSNWQSGIPYINITGDDYGGGTSYTSGTNGIGTSAVASAIASDRTFHLDMEPPLDPVFSLVAPSPADNATDAYATRELVMTFSQNVTPGTGNLTIRNLTDNTDTTLPANDSRLTYDQNIVRLNPAGLIAWSKSYAIRIDAGMFLGDGGAPVTAITDDTTWNFTTLAEDPLLAAIAAIKGHVNNTVPLTGPQLSAHKTTIDNSRQRFAENTTIISAVFDLITTYDTVKGPLFVSGFPNNSTSFDRNVTTGTAKNSVSPENYHWVIYTVMQHAMDIIYTAENLAKYESTLTSYKFGSHSSFPGPCSPPANPANTHSVQINGSFPVTFGRNTQMWTSPARKPTGTYLAPGTFATVTVPAAFVNAGYKIRVGAHSWDLSYRRPVNRLERATRLYSIDSTTTRIASPYGGGIYIEVPFGASAGIGSVTVTGGVRAPYFSAKSFHQTTAPEWDTEKTNPAPWADFQSEKFMIQVPRKWIYNMTGAQATQLMVDWDKAMDAINDLMGFPRNRGKETMYCQTDVILRSSVHAPGYPAVNVTSNVNSEVSPVGYAGNYLVRGPATTLTAANTEFHEQGHAYGFPKFGGETESNVNLLQPAMLYRAFGKTIDEAQNGSFGGGNSFITVDTTAIAWMCVFSFSPNEIPMQEGEKKYQHKGHAKWMDIARIYATPTNPNAGWEKLDAYWKSFMLDDANNIPYGTGTDDLLLRLSRAVGKDIRPLFHFWGIHPQNPSALAAALAAENLTPDPAIKAKLLHYKSIVPANNAAFQAFCLSWWGRKPSVAGYWEETDHAMQWDETLDADGTNDPNVRPAITTGSKYVEGCAAEIRARVDELVDLYFPIGMTPSTMSFTVAPTVLNATTITMTATTVTAASPPVQYYFENTTTNTNSGWISIPTWTQTGLATDQSYSYKVKARDVYNTENNESLLATVNLTSAGDVTPPSPDPMTFAVAPAAEDEQSITMTATTATDVNGVEYYFENITNSTNSGWQDSPVHTETNLLPLASYTYRVRARDKSAGQNATAFSGNATASTADLPDETPPALTEVSPADGSLVPNLGANLVATFDEPIIAASGSITLKNLTDSTEAVFNIGDPAVTIAGNTLTLNPPTDLLYGKDYAVQISSNAVGDLSNNPFAGINDDTTWSFTAILADPIALTGGPYAVPQPGSLSLNGSASAPSHLQTIVSYEWDLNNDGTFGDVTGATPAAITEAVLTSTWGMNVGLNTIGLRVTDSAAKTATATTTVKIGIILAWDANGAGAGQTNGAGAWLGTGLWWDGTTNTDWVSGSAATFGGPATAAGAVTLASPTTVGSLTFSPSYTGTYTLGTAGQTITLNSGITKNAGSAAATIISPITLGGAQIWTNNSAGQISTGRNTNLINNAGFDLTVDGTGITNFGTINNAEVALTGSGNLIKSGAGRLNIGGVNAGFSGTVTINGGVLQVTNNNEPMGLGNLAINSGVYSFYWGATYTRTLGSGNSQVQILGGESGVAGAGTTGPTINLGSTVVWGASGEGSATGFFNPGKFVLGDPGTGNAATTTFSSAINLNGAMRTILVPAGFSAGRNRSTISGRVFGTADLVKEGGGFLFLTNGYSSSGWSGSTTVSAGILDFTNANMANIGGGSARNITVAAGAGVRFNALSNAILNRIVETTDEIGVMTATTGNNFDFSSSTGATLPNAFLGNWAGNGAKAEISGIITPGSNGYKFGATGSSGLLGITGALTGANTLTVGMTGSSDIRVSIVAANTHTGDTVINTGCRLTLGNNLALQNSPLDVGSAGGNFSLAAGTNTGRITGETAAPSPTFGGLIGSRNLYSVFSSAVGNNETNLANTAVTGFTLNVGTGNTFTYSGNIGGFGTGAGTGGAAGTLGNSTLTKTGDGTQILAGTHTYTGATTVSGGTLSLGATGSFTNSTSLSIGGGATLDTSGQASYAIPASQPLTFGIDPTGAGSSGRITAAGLDITNAAVTLNPAATLDDPAYVLATYSGTLAGASFASVAGLPPGYTLDYAYQTNKIALVATTGDVTPPTLVSIADNVSGGPVNIGDTVTYTVTFDEDMDDTTVAADDFGNNGSAAVSIGTVTETTPGVFSVPVTTTGTGTLILRINLNAELKDVAGNALDTDPALLDGDTITVRNAYQTWALSNAIGSTPDQDKDGDGVSNAVEFLLGGDVSTNDIDKLPEVTAPGTDMVVTFQRKRNTIDGITGCMIEVGTTLAAWPNIYTVGTNTGNSTAGVTVAENSPSGFDTITLTVPRGPDAKKFARLNVAVTP